MQIDPNTLIAAYQRKVAELQHENLVLSAALGQLSTDEHTHDDENEHEHETPADTV